ncbi:MAG: Flp family type IVb pilin [Bacteroidota bacterium]
MKDLDHMVVRLMREEDGAAASEYAILVALIAAAVAAAVKLFNLESIFSTVSGKVIALINGT